MPIGRAHNIFEVRTLLSIIGHIEHNYEVLAEEGR